MLGRERIQRRGVTEGERETVVSKVLMTERRIQSFRSSYERCVPGIQDGATAMALHTSKAASRGREWGRGEKQQANE